MFLAVLGDYIRWHYRDALFHYLRLLRTAWWFIVSYFSMPILIRTLFKPYRKMGESDTKTWQAWLDTSIMNSLSRIVGFSVRVVLLGAGFVSLCLITILGIVGYFVWLIAPLLPASLVFFGTSLIIITLSV